MRTRSTIGFATALVLVLGGCAAPAAVAPSAAPSAAVASARPWPLSSAATIGTAADDGARTIKVDTLDERTRDLTIESPSAGTVQVRILLPASFGDDPAARFPVLTLLHGGDGEYSDWDTKVDVKGITSSLEALVVMPAAATSFGREGNTQGAGIGGRAVWEPFLTSELNELLERNWQASDQRAIAGLSLGGYTSVLLAARHPGMYKAVASYSGALNIKALAGSFIASLDSDTLATIQRTIAAANELGAYSVADLAPLLRATKSIYISYGNGRPGPLDPPDRRFPSPLERWCGGGSDLFVAELRKADIPVTVDDYGDGTHSWEYWDRALRESLPMLVEAIGLPAPAVPASPGA